MKIKPGDIVLEVSTGKVYLVGINRFPSPNSIEITLWYSEQTKRKYFTVAIDPNAPEVAFELPGYHPYSQTDLLEAMQEREKDNYAAMAYFAELEKEKN